MRYVLSAMVVVAALASTVAAQQEPTQLPVSRVVLFRSGVGYFEHIGSVEGEAETRLMFKTDQINDVLKSMVLMDLDGGTVSSVNYAARDPLLRALKSFAVDISGKPSLAQLLDQLRGAEVTVKAPEALSGKVLGVERVQKQVTTGGSTTLLTENVLNLVTEAGIKSLPLSTIHSIELQDKTLRAELSKALELLIASHDTQRKAVDVHFVGEGERRVRIGYIVETPVWKTSYRLDLSGDKPILQGWAIVENTTDADWANVDLALVSGRPISFIQDLYTPLYVPRPVVVPELYASLRPQSYAEGIETDEEDGKAEFAAADRARVRGATAPGMTLAKERRKAGGYAGRLAEGGMRDISLGRGVQSVATAADVGELFQFAIAEPVTLARRGSAMLPIINAAIKAEKVSIYNSTVLAKHPLNGAWVTNDTGMKLMGGPVTVFDGGSYGGDAQFDNMVQSEKRLISYAVDLDVTVDPSAHSTSKLVSGKIVRGVLHLRRLQTYVQTYKIKNKADQERMVIVEHPFNAQRKLVKPTKYEEKTPSLYRFRVEVAAAKTQDLEVREEHVQSETIALLTCPANRLIIYSQNAELSKKVREALKQVIETKNKLASLKSQRQRAQAELNSITSGQDRLRRNIGTVGRDSTLGRRYLTKLGEQEDRIEELQKQIQDLNKQIADQEEKLADMLKDLDIG